jgi:3-oxoacyl-[acyl-carrier protein] reductase
MDLGLTGKKVLVQGSSSGLGLAIAKQFVLEGAVVAICSRNREKIEQAAKEIGATAFVCDLDQKGASRQLVRDVIQKFHGLDVVVTNTGGPKAGFFSELSLDDWQTGFEKLFQSPVETIQEALPYMQKQKWGRLILITSTAAKEPILNLTLSSSFRSGLLGLTKVLSQQVGKDGITVNAILPGYTKTERLQELGKDDEELAKDIPVQRLGKPEEIGALAAFLGSSCAGFINGQAIACDGGLIKGV